MRTVLRFYRDPGDEARPTWKLRRLLAGGAPWDKVLAEMDRLDRFIAKIDALHHGEPMKKIALVIALCLLPALAWADGPVLNAATCSATFLSPQTNTDGSTLTDLKEWRIYVAQTTAALAATTVPNAVITAPNADPVAGQQFVWTNCRQLAPGQWYVTASAVDTSGNEGPRSPVGPFVLPDAVAPAAPGAPVLAPVIVP